MDFALRSEKPKVSPYVFSESSDGKFNEKGALGKAPKPLFFQLVGGAGFEPAALALQALRANPERPEESSFSAP
jgi:hypothetical protein